MRVIFALLALACFLVGCKCSKPRVRNEFNNHMKNFVSQAERLDQARMKKALDSGKVMIDTLLNQLVRHNCFEKRMRKQMGEFAHVRLSAKLYDQMWQRFDSISSRLENRERQIQWLRDSINSMKLEIQKLQEELGSRSMPSGALQYISDVIKTSIKLTSAQSELLSLETALIEPTLEQAIQRSEQRLLQSDVFAARQVFLKDLLALKLKLKIK